MLKVGITGGIGSGKTTVCKIFEQLGIPVYYADDRAKRLMVEDPQLVRGIMALLGEEAYTPEGQLDRTFVANIVFNNPGKLAQLNDLVHPAVARDGAAWQEKQTEVPYTLKEAALLYEAGSYRALDRMICVVAPEEMCIQRVMERDRVDRAAVLARMDKQWPQAQKARLADFLIYNDGTQSLVQQVVRIHKRLKSI